MLASPGLPGGSSKHRPWLLACPVKPGNDTCRVNLIVKRASPHLLISSINGGPRPIEVADHQDRTAYDPDPDALMQSERISRDCGHAGRRGGRETRFHRTR